MASLWRIPSKRIRPLDTTTFSAVFIVITMTVLIIFMMPPYEVCRRGLAADLPETYTSLSERGANRMDAISITVMRDGTVFFSTDKVSPNDLAEKIHERLKQGAERKVYISSDARVRYGTVVEVLDVVRDSGIQNVAFLVEQRKPAL